VTPTVVARAEGAYLYDVHGRPYLDTVAALGAVVLGHAEPTVTAAVGQQLRQGVAFSLPHTLEIEVAEQLVDLLPGVEQVRFAKNGADVTQAAVRLARHVTGRWQVLCCGYHGGHDFYIATTANRGGVLLANRVYTHQLTWGDYAQWKGFFDVFGRDLAAVIYEIPPWRWGDEVEVAFARWLERQAHAHGALVILDDIVTGFREHPSGAATRFALAPDLICVGKGLANGWPLAALGGPRALMQAFAEGQVFLSTTNGGEASALAAAQATLRLLTEGEAWARLQAAGRGIGAGLSALVRDLDAPAELLGTPARMTLRFRDRPGVATAAQLKTLWLQETITHGVLFGGPLFPMACYELAEVDQLVEAAAAGLTAVREAVAAGAVASRLTGPTILDVFGARYAPERGTA
jgi:glutamate-1-semialdehyde aminotransferase